MQNASRFIARQLRDCIENISDITIITKILNIPPEALGKLG